MSKSNFPRAWEHVTFCGKVKQGTNQLALTEDMMQVKEGGAGQYWDDVA